MENMKVLKARVSKGRLVLNEPTDLPEGTEADLVFADEVFADDGRSFRHGPGGTRAARSGSQGNRAGGTRRDHFCRRACEISGRHERHRPRLGAGR